MTTDIVEFTRQGADFESHEDVEETVRATLEALGECISTGEARDIGAFLPGEYEQALLSAEEARAEPLEIHEFLEYVAQQTGVPEDEAEHRIRAVMAALARIVGEPELGDARDQLPPEYGRFFETGGELIAEPFSAAVADETGFDEDEARTAARATLSTLAERLTRGEGEDLSHYVRGDAADWVVDDEQAEARDFGTDQFVRRVADRAAVSEERAETYIEEVTHVLAGVVPSEELDRAAAQLPDEYGTIITPAP